MKRISQNTWSLLNFLSKKMPAIALSLQVFCLVVNNFNIWLFCNFVHIFIEICYLPTPGLGIVQVELALMPLGVRPWALIFSDRKNFSHLTMKTFHTFFLGTARKCKTKEGSLFSLSPILSRYQAITLLAT